MIGRAARVVSRIRTTHVGSLPRPDALHRLLVARERGEPTEGDIEQAVDAAVSDVVRQQADVGLDLINDGEMSKVSYASYIGHRLTGFAAGDVAPLTPQDIIDFPGVRRRFAAMMAKDTRPTRFVCDSAVAVRDPGPLRADLARLGAALAPYPGVDGFMTAVSPGTIALFHPNRYYGSEEAYLAALADAMRPEYEAIASQGLLLQIDAPDLAMGRHTRFRNVDDREFLRQATLHVEALNHALAAIPSARMRLHVCWGNYAGPHTHDISLQQLLPVLLRARPAALSFEAANPRHQHEYEVWKTVDRSEDKVLVPGLIDTTTDFVEHPELIAQRLQRFAGIVGRDRIMAGTDCGFASAGLPVVDPQVCWAKLRALTAGARLAADRLWNCDPA